MKVGLLYNDSKPEATAISREISAWLGQNGYEMNVPPSSSAHGVVAAAGSAIAPDVVLILGGDGTLLKVAAEFAEHGLPLIGINLGHLGFLTEIERQNMYAELDALLQRHCEDVRGMLLVEVWRQDKQLARYLALNDAVLAKGPFARIIQLETSVNGDWFETYQGDGLIIATPTGSTAYALSAGGPVISPYVDAFVITPICPHSLSSRSLVVSGQDMIEVKLKGVHQDTYLTIDGQRGESLQAHDRIVLHKANVYTRLWRKPDWSFYQVLDKKLRETEGDNV